MRIGESLLLRIEGTRGQSIPCGGVLMQHCVWQRARERRARSNSAGGEVRPPPQADLWPGLDHVGELPLSWLVPQGEQLVVPGLQAGSKRGWAGRAGEPVTREEWEGKRGAHRQQTSGPDRIHHPVGPHEGSGIPEQNKGCVAKEVGNHRRDKRETRWQRRAPGWS